MIKGIALTAVRSAVQLMTIGTLQTATQWTNQELRKSTDHFIGEVKRGGEEAGRKMKLIKND